MDLGLQGKVAVVTGGSRGIGRASAASLVSEGADVVVCAREVARLTDAARSLDQAGPGRCVAVPADAGEASALESVIDRAQEEFGRLDILVNNVGTSARAPFLEADDQVWEADLQLKLFSAIRAARRALPLMAMRGGRIINVLSIGGKHPAAASAPTSVSRAAGIALTKVLSKEFAHRGVLVNAICVGIIRSGQHEDRWRAEGGTTTLEEWYEAEAADRGIPLGRVGTAEEVANLVVFLASEASSYISGTAINVDGAASSAT